MKRIIGVSAVLLLTGLTGCGGSGNSGGGSDLPPTRPAGSFSGVAHDAPLRNAQIKIYDWSTGKKGALLGQTETDGDGNYALELVSEDKPIMIVAGDSGAYTEEASGKSIGLSAGQNISAITNYQSGETLTLQVTPFTNLARCYAEYLVAEGESVPDALNLANSKIASIAGVEIIQTKPIDVTDINSANIELTPGLKYGFLTAGISTSMADVSGANGLDPHSETFLTSMQWSRVACNDIKADGMLNGNGYIDSTTIGSLAFGTYPITPIMYRNILAQRILSFAKSDENKTGLDIEKLLVFANALSTNTDSIWAGEPGQPVDNEGPAVGLQLAENSYIGGTTDIPFSIDDPVGVKTISFYVDNGLVTTNGPTGTTLNLNTSNYTDGSHVVKVVAVDLIGNETTLLATYNISNTGPAINMTSAAVVGSTDYTATGTWISSGSDIQSITVDGEAATINPDGTWEANITLTSGQNSFGVVAVDELTNSTTQSYQVGVDLLPPSVTPRTRSILHTTYQGQYALCNYENFVTDSSVPLCVRSDRVSLNGASADRNLQSLNFVYLEFSAGDVVGANVYSQFEDLKVEYKYEKNDELVVDWTSLNTGFKSSIPGSLDGYYILPITTEYLGSDWFITSTTDNHVVTVKVTDNVGHSTLISYKMQFDVLLYNVTATGSSDGASVINKPFTSRSTIFGNSVSSVATISNGSDNPIYMDFSTTDNHSIEQVYETAIRVNRMATISTEHWRARYINAYNSTSSWIDINSIDKWNGSDWDVIEAPVITSDFTNVYQDVVPVQPDTDWADNSDMICHEGSGYSDPSWSWSEGGTQETTFADYRFDSHYACVSVHTYFIQNPALLDEWVVHRNMEKYTTYENIYESGFPRNNLNSTTLNHTISDSTSTVFSVTNNAEITNQGGYYIIPAGVTVEIRKNITLPLLPDYNDTEVANIDTFSSYDPKDLDKTITWTLDESIDIKLYAAIGASALRQTSGSINTYTIAR